MNFFVVEMKQQNFAKKNSTSQKNRGSYLLAAEQNN